MSGRAHFDRYNSCDTKLCKCLRQFGMVWLNLQNYQKCGVRLVLMILLSYLMGHHQEYLQRNRPCINLIYLKRSSRWSPRGIFGYYTV